MQDGGVFVTKSEQVSFRIIEDYRAGKLSRKETALLLGVSERAVTRQTKRVREKGLRGVKHGNCGKAPANLLPANLKQEMLRLAADIYPDFNLRHRLEMIEKLHGLKVSYGTFYGWCRKAGLGKSKKRRRSKAHTYRERMANEGLLLQMDGSHHEWNGKDRWCLIALIDDATSDIPYAGFYDGETTLNCMKALRGVIEAKGLPEIIYTDEAGWAGGGEKRRGFSQFVRACDELGIKVITTSSAEAKGRIERAWRTFQDRLIPELAHYGIKGMTDANRYLEQSFLQSYWRERNTVAPRSEMTRYRALPRYINLDDILCMKYERIVRRDHTVWYDNETYKIVDQGYGNLSDKVVTIHVYENASVALFLGHRKLEIELVARPSRRWSKSPA
jgi:transposase